LNGKQLFDESTYIQVNNATVLKSAGPEYFEQLDHSLRKGRPISAATKKADCLSLRNNIKSLRRAVSQDVTVPCM
jgi:hypothetical protein